MATAAQIANLRRRVQDFYNKRTKIALTTAEQAFTDTELTEIIDDAAAEVTDGSTAADDLSAFQQSWMLLIARADAILQIAQDESRRIRWQAANEIVDPTQVAPNLVRVAEALQKRYLTARQRKLDEQVQGVENRPAGGIARFNATVGYHSERNFNNPTINRNKSSDHKI